MFGIALYDGLSRLVSCGQRLQGCELFLWELGQRSEKVGTI
jgi:hypothetical protein